MSLNTPLKNVRGLGSAKEGTHHFWWQRLTAIALVPLLVWVVIAGMAATLSDYESARAMVGHPVSAVLAICTIVTLFHHAQLGLQVVIEDYIHQEWLKITALLAVKFLAVVFALLGVIAVLRIAVGS
jgi:succinate dehydrogenase / fumarate reductase membrane anchor subunit